MSRKNEVVAIGRVKAIRQSANGKTILTVVTKSGRNDVHIPFICKDGIPAGVGFRSHVKVVGHVDSVTFHTEDNKTRHELRINADSIEPCKTLAEESFGERGKFYPAPTCSVVISGNIKTIVSENDWIRIMMEVNTEADRKTYIRTSMKRLERQPELAEGDEIGVVGSITTPIKKKDGKEQRYVDIIISDLAKLKEDA